MNKKDLIIAVLATFCLTVTIFMIFPTKSAEPYDPWADVSGPTIGEPDGTINMRDISYEILRFNTFGDTTKNVTVTNWRTNELLLAVNTTVFSDDWYFSKPISLEGFSRVSICLHCGTNNNFYQLTCKDSNNTWTFIVENIDNIPTTIVKTYDVPNEYIMISFWNKAMTDLAFHLDVYGIA